MENIFLPGCPSEKSGQHLWLLSLPYHPLPRHLISHKILPVLGPGYLWNCLHPPHPGYHHLCLWPWQPLNLTSWGGWHLIFCFILFVRNAFPPGSGSTTLQFPEPLSHPHCLTTNSLTFGSELKAQFCSCPALTTLLVFLTPLPRLDCRSSQGQKPCSLYPQLRAQCMAHDRHSKMDSSVVRQGSYRWPMTGNIK